MHADWFDWVGRTIADDIPLLGFLGGAGDTAIFSTAILDRQGVVRLFSIEDAAKVKERLATFKKAEKLSHPHLLRVFRTGKCKVDEENLVYMVTEFAEENVAQVLPERTLTSEETRALLTATLAALQYLHAHGFAHADLKPSHIMATGNQLKISVDGVHLIGEPLARTTTSPYDAPEARTAVTAASDMWSLGVTLAKVLTQRIVESPKEADKFESPFREIVMRCLAQEPEQRPSLIDIYNILDGKEVAPPPASAAVLKEAEVEQQAPEPEARPARTKSQRRSKPFKLSPLAIGAAAAAVVLIVVIALGLSRRGNNEPTNAGDTQPVARQNGTAHSSESPKTAASLPATNTKPPSVTKRVIPDVSPDARGTITGTVRVGVKVSVDPKGDVVDTDLMALGPSQYFDRLAIQAAQQWKFSPSSQSTAWELQFNFTKKDTTVVPTLVSR